jgi:hypothetical protein
MPIPNLVLISTEGEADGEIRGPSAMKPWKLGNRIIGVDPELRRLWVGGQRLHHGLTGLALLVAGGVLIAHDWKDRSVWFRFGAQSD